VEGTLQIHLFGPLRLTFEGSLLDTPMPGRVQSLLAYLLLHSDAPQSRAKLSFTFWPEASEANARNSLRQLLHQLRQALPDPDRYLRTDATSVQWSPGSFWTLDVAQFDRALGEAEGAGKAGDAGRRRACLERAVELCRGPLLPSCYDDWIGPVRERLMRRCEDALAALVGLLEGQREYPGAIAHVRRWLELDPLDEAAYRWLMRLLALTGDRPAALQAYRQCAEARGSFPSCWRRGRRCRGPPP
jgi:DNA-binding SARP family transcriptional activator